MFGQRDTADSCPCYQPPARCNFWVRMVAAAISTQLNGHGSRPHQYTPGWSKVTVAEPSWVGGMICWSSGTSSITAAGGRKEEGKKVMHASKDGSMA